MASTRRSASAVYPKACVPSVQMPVLQVPGEALAIVQGVPSGFGT